MISPASFGELGGLGVGEIDDASRRALQGALEFLWIVQACRQRAAIELKQAVGNALVRTVLA